jgi:hypothetical protein
MLKWMLCFKGTISSSNYEFINTGGTLRGNYTFAPVFINGPETVMLVKLKLWGFYL